MLQSFLRSEELLGTVVSIEIVGSEKNNAEEHLHKAFQEIKRIEQQFSRFLESSEVSRLNSRLQEWVEVSDELFFMLEQALTITEKNQGAFNVCVQSMLEDLGYDKNYSFQKKANTVEAEDMSTIGQVFLRKPSSVKISAPVDLGAIGKGYALDRIKKKFSSVENFCVDAGGDLYVKGVNAAHEPWKIAFEHPLDVQKAIGFVRSSDLFFAASSPLKRTWKNYHHLIDPKTQKPADNMLAVFTQGNSGLLVDGYATALFVLGFEKARKILGSLPVEAMLIDKNGAIICSKGFQGELFVE